MIIIVGGPSGCGKSTIGQDMAKKLHYSFIEGDSLHPQANIDKMAHGIPLTDDDRWGWLASIAEAAKGGNCVVSCSALKKSYRDYLLERLQRAVVVIALPSKEELERRMESRQGHFMKANMLQSQLNTLEVPENEPFATVIVPKDPETTTNEAIEAAKKLLA